VRLAGARTSARARSDCRGGTEVLNVRGRESATYSARRSLGVGARLGKAGGDGPPYLQGRVCHRRGQQRLLHTQARAPPSRGDDTRFRDQRGIEVASRGDLVPGWRYYRSHELKARTQDAKALLDERWPPTLDAMGRARAANNDACSGLPDSF
jgi:hypothetical protein